MKENRLIFVPRKKEEEEEKEIFRTSRWANYYGDQSVATSPQRPRTNTAVKYRSRVTTAEIKKFFFGLKIRRCPD